MQFCKMMGYLRNYFEVYAIDLLGMGASGRPQDINFTSFENCLDFFTGAINKWTKINNLGQNNEKFYLLGHSLGGMIAGHYALKYPQ